jgi:hypothetical protein
VPPPPAFHSGTVFFVLIFDVFKHLTRNWLRSTFWHRDCYLRRRQFQKTDPFLVPDRRHQRRVHQDRLGANLQGDNPMKKIPSRDTTGKCRGECRDRVKEGEVERQAAINGSGKP